jgi:hypothetical protein
MEAEKKPKPVHIPPWKSLRQILLHSIRDGSKVTTIAFAIKSLVAILIRLLKFKRIKKECFTDSIRFGGMVGGFTFLWKLVSNALYFKTNKVSKWNGFIAGSIAGLAVLFESKENRIGYAQQFFMRSMQTSKNVLKSREVPTFPHGDSILFALACASIMHAYAFRPDTLPREYYSWMGARSRIPKASLQVHREHVRAMEIFGKKAPVNMDRMESTLKLVGATPHNKKRIFDYIHSHQGAMPGIPCAIFHPKSNSCVTHSPWLFYKVFVEMIPVYLSLNAVPLAFFKTKKVIAK